MSCVCMYFSVISRDNGHNSGWLARLARVCWVMMALDLSLAFPEGWFTGCWPFRSASVFGRDVPNFRVVGVEQSPCSARFDTQCQLERDSTPTRYEACTLSNFAITASQIIKSA